MEITEVKIKLTNSNKSKLKAFCSIIFNNALVVHDVKIIDGTKGAFVAMPSRKLTRHCVKCATNNHLLSKFCNNCGASLPPVQLELDEGNRPIFYADVVHPINSACREMIQDVVLKYYAEEVKKSAEPGYNQYKNYPTNNYKGQAEIL
jgi:stage V sporulation protein G